MKKIPLSLSPDQLFALEKLLNQLYDFSPTTSEGFATKSACLDVAELVHRKYRKTCGDVDLFNSKKEITINLKYHECDHLFKFFVIMEYVMELSFELQKIKNFLDQKLA